jgi:hypothetical protein
VIELADLEIDQHIAAQQAVEENQIDKEMLCIEGETLLPRFKEKAFAEFQQEMLELVDDGRFQRTSQMSSAKWSRKIQPRPIQSMGSVLADLMAISQTPSAKLVESGLYMPDRISACNPDYDERKAATEFRGEFDRQGFKQRRSVLGPFLALLFVYDNTAANLEVGQYLDHINGVDHGLPSGTDQVEEFANQLLHSANSHSRAIIHFSAASIFLLISCSGCDDWHWKNSRLRPIPQPTNRAILYCSSTGFLLVEMHE